MATAADAADLSPDCALDYLLQVGALKKTKRTGWVENGVPLFHVESVGDHSHRMALITLLNRDPDVDTDKLVRVALMHDVAESIVGDLSPKQMREQGISKEDKFRMEKAAMVKIAAQLDHPAMTARLYDYWEEYERLESKEALWIKDIDYLEMCIQAFTYEQDHHVDLEGFYNFANDAKVAHPWLRQLRAALRARRDAWLAASGVQLQKVDRPAVFTLPDPPSVLLPCAAALAVGVAVGWILRARS
eukprot:TRINITY_DN8358_c0_g1_i1.p1 TRINITY_DN8358_c0_g1~~TRINITY_DN8358_c0_g1_i1.p1  ORF type:complete len:246 (+),score=90.56 TRINITY_DN8358_c0_g1_i1:72-809(+)